MTTLLQPASVRILADDLTGACDAAVAFASLGISTQVTPLWEQVESHWNAFDLKQKAGEAVRPQVLAFNTESRELSPEISTARIVEIGTRFAADPSCQVFKTVDSVFRGNTFAEILATLHAFPHDLAIVAPAYPELGRTLVQGKLHHQNLSSNQIIPVLEGLRELGLDPEQISQASQIQCNSKLVLCDSYTQQDLSELVRHALAINGRLLWIGSGGLAHALASSLAGCSAVPEFSTTGSKVLFLIGSDHPVTLEQISHLRLSASAATILSVPRGIPKSNLYDLVAPHLTQDLSCLFVTGGDTACAVSRALEIERLEVLSEFARGLPYCRIHGGPLDGVPFLLKSGGFGEQNILSRIAQTFFNQETSSIR